MTLKKEGKALDPRAAQILFPGSPVQEARLPFGLMRPLLPPPNWEAVMGKLKPKFVRPGLWYRDWVPTSWVEDAKSLEEAVPLNIGDWGDLFKLPDSMVQRRLEEGPACNNLPVTLDWVGPYKNEFGVRVANASAEQVIFNEGAALNVPGRNWNLLRITLGNNRYHHLEIKPALVEACKVPGSYLGPLCVMSTVPPSPTVV